GPDCGRHGRRRVDAGRILARASATDFAAEEQTLATATETQRGLRSAPSCPDMSGSFRTSHCHACVRAFGACHGVGRGDGWPWLWRSPAYYEILNHMVQYWAPDLDLSFAALSDATRRGVIEQLGRAEASITSLAERFQMTLTGMKKHVSVLE